MSHRIVFAVLVVLLFKLQGDLWFGDGSWAEVRRLQSSVSEQAAINRDLLERNDTIEADVDDLKSGLASIEERARTDFGMIKTSETFIQIIE